MGCLGSLIALPFVLVSRLIMAVAWLCVMVAITLATGGFGLLVALVATILRAIGGNGDKTRKEIKALRREVARRR